ncbi:MAG: hypothetical protein ABFD69_07690 [Candidatus Sumerlaeia bacterium]
MIEIIISIICEGTKMSDSIIDLVEALTGQRVPFQVGKERLPKLVEAHSHFRHSQFNELLLSLGYDRVSHDFFVWLFDGLRDETGQVQYANLKYAVERFEKKAIFLWGNVKYAFKRLSLLDSDGLKEDLIQLESIDKTRYMSRPSPLDPIEPIDENKTHLLGYITQAEINKRWPNDSQDPEAVKCRSEMAEIIDMGKANHDRYLTYDYMDVYIATSMRQRHEFMLVGGFVHNLFSRNDIQELKLRYFDPTQAYCQDRIDKGLVEALMLKRCRCTIYLVQEFDTLGKDSELAATLAQGKPVIAYVPELKDETNFINEALLLMKKCYPNIDMRKLILDQIRIYHPEGAWDNENIRKWIERPEEMVIEEAMHLLFDKAKAKYDKRAHDLSEKHPLGLQVHLESGVANGVLVVRSVDQCAKLLKSIVLNNLEFRIEREEKGRLLLKESISDCTFRVRTGDERLTNSFWNFYLQ